MLTARWWRALVFPNTVNLELNSIGSLEARANYRDALVAEYHKYPALPPVFDFMDNEAPDKVRKVKPVWTADGYILFWTAPKFKDEMNRPVQYVVYRFASKEKVDIDDPSHIVLLRAILSISCLMRMARRSTVM